MTNFLSPRGRQAGGIEDASIGEGSRAEWVLSSPSAQIVIVVSQIYFTLAVEERLMAAAAAAAGGGGAPPPRSLAASPPSLLQRDRAGAAAAAPASSWSMSGLHSDLVRQLGELTEVVRGRLSPLLRKSVVALVTIDVHNRDIVEGLVQARCTSKADFAWQVGG